MTYRAKNLPAWVRFRPKPQPKPVYTVPTKLEWMISEAINRAAGRLAQIGSHPTWLAAQRGPLRVRLKWD